MVRIKTIVTIHSIILLILAFFIIFSISILFVPYESVLDFINSFRPNDPYQFYTNEYHTSFKIVCLLFSILLFFSISLIYQKKEYCIKIIRRIIDETEMYLSVIRKEIRLFFAARRLTHNSIVLGVLFIGIIIRLMYINRPIFHDEAKTFYHFVSISWVNTISNYFNTNNHVFHSILSRLCYVLFGNEEWVFRIPSLLFGILTIVFIYIFSRKIFDKHIAILLFAFSANAIPLVSYSVNARGYTMITFFTLLLLCIIDSLNKKNSLLLWILFVIISSLGLWTVPTMVMPIIFLLFWYLLNTNRANYLTDLFRIVFVGLACIFLSIIFYSPIILRAKGMAPIIANEYIKSLEYKYIIDNLINYLLTAWEFFYTGYFDIVQVIIFFIFIIGIIAHLGNEKHRKLLFSFFFLIIFVMVLLKKLPFARTLLFIYPIIGLYIVSGILLLCKKFANLFQLDLEKIVNVVALSLFILSTVTCINEKGIIYNWRNQTFPQAELVIKDLKNIINPNDMIETSTPLAGPVRYYIVKNDVNENQMHWHSMGKTKNRLIGKDNIYIITRQGRNNLKSFGYNQFFSLEGYTPPRIWKEYQNTVKVYIISRLSS